MMASMVPATLQMFMMTKQMVGATAGMVGFGTATTGAAVAVGTLDKAMKFLSKNVLMISITVLATIGAAAFAKFGGKAEEAEAAATSFGDSISALNYDLDKEVGRSSRIMAGMRQRFSTTCCWFSVTWTKRFVSEKRCRPRPSVRKSKI